jgi:hypothetical protein
MMTLPNTRFPDPHFQGFRPKPDQPVATAPSTARTKSAFPLHPAPSAELMRALYVPASRKAQALRFSGQPPAEEMQGIIDSLGGWKNQPTMVGPTYFATPDVAAALKTSLAEQSPVPQDAVDRIALHKARVQNIHNLLLGKPPVSPADLQKDASDFIDELQTRVRKLNHDLKQKQSKLSEPGLALFNRFAAETAPIQHAMGFPDAVAHAADVAQLTCLLAIKQGATEPEALQALMVGWLHDPKLPGTVSWSNLATHPVIASSIAKHILGQPEFKDALTNYLNTFQGSQNADQFTNGVVEALSINNDSKWVLDNVILHKFPYSPLSEPGIADVPDDQDKVVSKAIEALFTNRFLAPSEGKPLQDLPPNLLNQVNRTALSTDLRGIDYRALPDAVKRTVTPESLDTLLAGNPNDQGRWAQTQQLLRDHLPNIVINPKVKGGTLASHHAEVEQARLAALGLAKADPPLLSPHKIMAQTKGDTALERLASFVDSFENNIRFLPQDAKPDGEAWKNEVFRAILESADTLTGNRQLASQEVQEHLNDAQFLKQQVLAAKTWQGRTSQETNVDYGAAVPSTDPSSDFGTLLSSLKKHYEAAVDEVLMQAPPSSSIQSARMRRLSYAEAHRNSLPGLQVGLPHQTMGQAAQ